MGTGVAGNRVGNDARRPLIGGYPLGAIDEVEGGLGSNSPRNILSSDDRGVVVSDDFATTGISLEWACNLLYAAGADRMVITTIGKLIVACRVKDLTSICCALEQTFDL